MNRTIELIAEGVLTNSRILEKLLDQLPPQVKEAVATIVAPVVSAPVVSAPVVAAPVVAPVVAAPVVSAPVVTAPVVTAPVVTAPVVTAPVVTAPALVAPFDNATGMIGYVTDKWKALGPTRGNEIQTVLTAMGCENINDVTPDKYGQLFAALENLK